MEVDKISDRQKCGEILINLKTIRNKSKVFIFHCALCSVNCDQLKKFSKHLENHLHYFENDLGKSYDPDNEANKFYVSKEIKVEELVIDRIDKSDGGKAVLNISSEICDDPLGTAKLAEKESSYVEHLVQKNSTTEYRTQNKNLEGGENKDAKLYPDRSDNIHHTDSDNDLELYMGSRCMLNNVSSSDGLSDYSTDADSDIKKDLNTLQYGKTSQYKITKKKSVKSKRQNLLPMETNENDAGIVPSAKKPKKRRRVIIQAILPFLLQQYKNHKMLWQVHDIAFGIKNKKYETYAKIAEALKQEANQNLSLDDLNYHINYLNELYSKDKGQELKCKMEEKEFTPENEYYNAMSFLSESQGPFLCAICNEILPTYYLHCQHIAKHNETQPFKCPACNAMFTNYHKYLVHKKRHLGILDFHCDICGKGYMFKNDLEWHITSHTGDKPYLCQICGTGFRARHGYDNHIRRHEERFRHECHICKRGFNQLYALNNHVKSHLNIRDVICKICGKGFVHTKYLKRHELIHGTEKRYKCNECGKAFFQACGLRVHRKNHHP